MAMRRRVVGRLVLRSRATGAHFVDVHRAYKMLLERARSETCGLRCDITMSHVCS